MQKKDVNPKLSADLWLLLVKYAIAYTALSFGDDPIGSLIKMHTFGRVTKFCGDKGTVACQKILDINAGLATTSRFQRRLQCNLLRKTDILPIEMIDDLEHSAWPTTSMFERAAYVKGTAECVPNASINQVRQAGNMQMHLGMTVMEFKSNALLEKLLQAGFTDNHAGSTTCLEIYFSQKNFNALKILLANGRHELYPSTMLCDHLSVAVLENEAKLVEIYLSLPVDYVAHHNFLVSPFKEYLDGQTPRTDAQHIRNKKKIVKLLCNFRNPSGQGFELAIPGREFNVLYAAVLSKQNDLLQILLTHIAPVAVQHVINQSFDHETPLGLAAAFNHYAMVKQLLDAGANPNLPEDKPNHQPLALTNSFDIRLLLQQHGAKSNTFYNWKDLDMNGRVVSLRPLAAEALFGTADSLEHVLAGNDFGSVNMMDEDAAAPIVYALARLTGIIPESGFRNQNDKRLPFEIVDDCIKKFNLLVNAGADINANILQGLQITLIELALLTKTIALLKLLAPLKPKLSANANVQITMMLNTPQLSEYLPMITVLVEAELISENCFYPSLGFAISCGNIATIKILLANLSKYNFDEDRQRYLLTALWMHFKVDKSQGRSKFYEILNLILWQTDLSVMPLTHSIPADEEKLYNVYSIVIKGKVSQTQSDKARIVSERNNLNKVPAAQQLKEPPLSGRHFLTEQGYSSTEISALQQPVQIKDVNIQQIPVVKTTWCGGKISSDDAGLICLENTNPPKYLFIDRTLMLNSGCSENDLKKLMRVRRLGENDKRCISSIKGKLRDVSVTVQLCDTLINVPIKGEIRDADIEARLLCGPAIKSDQGGAKLIVAVAYISSMHNDSNMDNLLRVLQSGKLIELDYPYPKSKNESSIIPGIK